MEIGDQVSLILRKRKTSQSENQIDVDVSGDAEVRENASNDLRPPSD